MVDAVALTFEVHTPAGVAKDAQGLDKQCRALFARETLARVCKGAARSGEALQIRRVRVEHLHIGPPFDRRTATSRNGSRGGLTRRHKTTRDIWIASKKRRPQLVAHKEGDEQIL